MGKRKFLKRMPGKEDMSLQITSMADILIIMLVFLLKSFATGVTSITPSDQISLPEANSTDEVKESLKIEISQNVILVDDKPVTTLHAFQFDKTDVESDGTPRSLNAVLIKERARRPASTGPATQEPAAAANSAQANPLPSGTPEDPNNKLMILADEKTPYSILQAVLASAGNTGWNEFKLVVVEDR